MSRLAFLSAATLCIILSSAANKVFFYYQIPTALYVIPLVAILALPTSFDVSLRSWLMPYAGILTFSCLLGLAGQELTPTVLQDILRVIIAILFVMKLRGLGFTRQHIQTLLLIAFYLNTGFLIYSKFANFDIYATVVGADIQYVSRFGGLGINPNVQAYLIVLLFVGIHIGRETLRPTVLFIGLFSLYLTFSFTGFLAFLSALTILTRRLKYSMPQLLGYSLVGVSGLIYTLTQEVSNVGHTASIKIEYAKTFLQTGQGLNNLTTNRTQLGEMGLAALRQNFLVGHGLGYGGTKLVSGADLGVHNTLLEFLIDFGIPLGFFFFILLFRRLHQSLRLPVLIMALAGHGFFYNLNFVFILLLISLYEIHDES